MGFPIRHKLHDDVASQSLDQLLGLGDNGAPAHLSSCSTFEQDLIVAYHTMSRLGFSHSAMAIRQMLDDDHIVLGYDTKSE